MADLLRLAFGTDDGFGGRARRIAASTTSSPINVAAEVQP